MKVLSDLFQLLRVFALKEQSSRVSFLEFYDYLQRYCRHYLEKKQELAVYLEISRENLIKELKKLQDKTAIEIITDRSNDTTLFIPYFFIDDIAKKYTIMANRPDVPFPILSELSLSFPNALIRRLKLSDEFVEIKKNEEGRDFLYDLNFNGEFPSLVFPGAYTAEKLLNLSLMKIRFFLSKDEARHYMQKRLMVANPGKEFSIRNFISSLATYSTQSLSSLKEAGDSYIFWGQFCAFVKQEFSKKTEKLADETALLQAVSIVEYLNNYYRAQSQKGMQSETALKNLLLEFQKQPYYFTMSKITKFVDSRGIPLLGQYTEEALQDFMKEKTTSSEKYIVPDILTFRNELNERFYLLAEKAIPLLISFINETRKLVRDACIKKWHDELLAFDQNEAMKQDYAFANLVKSLTAELNPNLYGFLNATFISVLVTEPKLNEVQAVEIHRICPNGKLAAYSDILMLNRSELLSDTKILLPFWYTIPIISAIIAFFKRPRNKAKQQATTNKKKDTVQVKPKLNLKDVAEELASNFVLSGLTFDETLQRYLDGWNQNLDPEARKNLTEDVNVLIRDYIRGVQRTISTATLTSDRIKSLASTLVNIPSLSKIKDKNSLKRYVELYILTVVKKYF